MAAVGRSFFGKFFGNTVGEAAAFAMGTVTGPALGPLVQDIVNEARHAHRVYPIGVLDAAQLVAEGVYDLAHGDEVAGAHGIGSEPFADLVRLARVAPQVPLALTLWRRGAIDEAAVDHALAKAKIEPEYRGPLKSLVTERLDPAVIATAVQRGIMRDPGFLPVAPPSERGKVEPFPVSPLDALTEALASGVDKERLFVETAIVGNPASPDLAARMVFREIIDRVDFDRAIAEGNTRNEWADVLFEGFRQIPTAHDGIEGRLRGWLTDAEMYAETARHGMSHEDTDLLFKINGRPPSWHQIWIGLQRGGTYNGPVDMIDPAFLKGLQESNLRPEWYNLLWHSRYNYPSAFVMRQLTQSGTITQALAEQVLKFEGWEPTFAKTVSEAWAGGGGVVADKNVAKAHVQLWTAAHRSYIAGESDRAQVTDALGPLAIPADALGLIFEAWDNEKALVHDEPSAAQVKKLYVATTWTHDEALARLVRMGWSLSDARDFLTT